MLDPASDCGAVFGSYSSQTSRPVRVASSCLSSMLARRCTRLGAALRQRAAGFVRALSDAAGSGSEPPKQEAPLVFSRKSAPPPSPPLAHVRASCRGPPPTLTCRPFSNCRRRKAELLRAQGAHQLVPGHSGERGDRRRDARPQRRATRVPHAAAGRVQQHAGAGGQGPRAGGEGGRDSRGADEARHAPGGGHAAGAHTRPCGAAHGGRGEPRGAAQPAGERPGRWPGWPGCLAWVDKAWTAAKDRGA